MFVCPATESNLLDDKKKITQAKCMATAGRILVCNFVAVQPNQVCLCRMQIPVEI